MIRYVYSFFIILFCLAGPSHGTKKKKKQEASDISEDTSEKADVPQNVEEKFKKKTKIPPVKSSKANSTKVTCRYHRYNDHRWRWGANS